MKAKTLSIALLVLTSTSAIASPSQSSVKFVAADLTPATNVCVIAVKQGVKAARVAAKKSMKNGMQDFYSMTCNGLPVTAFAKQYKIAKAN